MKRAVLYLRVSTLDQTTPNPERELREIAGRMGCDIVHVYKDHGISGAKGRDKRPAFDRLCRDAAKRQFDMVMAWSVDRLGRSLQDLVGFLSELHALRVDLFLHQQGRGSRVATRGAGAAGRTNAADRSRVAAASHAFAGRLEQAQKAMARLRQIDPVVRRKRSKCTGKYWVGAGRPL